MSQFAICYEPSDIAAIVAAANDARVPGALKQRVQTYWLGGLNTWTTAPLGNFNPNAPCPLCVICTINATNKGNAADFIQLLRDLAAALGDNVSSYLKALANDLAVPGSDSLREPYP